MTLKPFAPWRHLLSALLLIAIAPVAAVAASPEIEAAIKALQQIPADRAKFQSYCRLIGEMENVPETDEAKMDALDKQLDAIIDSYGAAIAGAWDSLTELDPESDDGKAVVAAFEAMEAQCP